MSPPRSVSAVNGDVIYRANAEERAMRVVRCGVVSDVIATDGTTPRARSP